MPFCSILNFKLIWNVFKSKIFLRLLYVSIYLSSIYLAIYLSFYLSIYLSISRDDPSYWTDGSYDDWLAEMAGARLIVERFANISDGTVIGKPFFLNINQSYKFKVD